MDSIKWKIHKMYTAGALHITMGTFATKFVTFFGSVFVVRLLSKNDYGLLSYVENLYSYAFIFAGFGLANGILRYLVLSEDPIEKKSIHDYIIRRSIIIDVSIALVMILAVNVIKLPENYKDAVYLIPIIAILLPFQDIYNEELYTIRSFFKNKLYAYLAFASSVLLIIGRIIGAKAYSTAGVLWSRTAINLVFAVVLIVYISKTMFLQKTSITLNKEKRKEINTYSFQYMITNGFWALFMLNDTFLIGALLNNPGVLAEYKVAYVLPGNISIFATAIGVFVGPHFTKNEKDREWIRHNFKRVFCLSAIIVACVAGVIAILAKPIILFMYDEQYINIIGLMRILLLGAFINSGLRYTTANILAALGDIKYNMIISGVGIIVQIVLDLVYIPVYGAVAAAVSNCIVFLLMAVALLIVIYKRYY